MWLILFDADVEGKGEMISPNTLYNNHIATVIAKFSNVNYQPEVEKESPIPYLKKVLKP